MWSRTSHRAYRRHRARVIRNSDTCAICGRDLQPDATFPDPWSTSADHITPISEGGDNLGPIRAVHLRCNQRRWQYSDKTRHGRQW